MNAIKLSLITLMFTVFITSCSKDEEQNGDEKITLNQIELLESQIVLLEKKLEESDVKVKVSEEKEDELEANKALVRNFYQEFFGDLNIQSIHKYIGDVYIQHNPGLADGKQALIDGATIWFQGGTPSTIDIQKLFAAGDLVFIHTRQSSGKVSVMDVFRVKDDLLVEHWDVIQSVPENSANPHPMF